ncbi:MAG: hypothetical protein RMJ98_00760 [Myxococcales bacterium]|nr:hypothetical protein [Polyangiaceae bacterium]MDW8247816.1 hypothetical protein [Myxococcales bacterium]
MAPRLWLWNLDAELELASPGRTTPSSAIRERIARLRPWLQGFLAPGDEVLDDEDARGFDRYVGVAWCPTPHALRRLRKAGALVPEVPSVEVLRAANHRRFCASLGQTLPGARFVEDLDALRAAVASSSVSGSWLLKRSLGFAGRGQLRVTAGPLPDEARRWAEASLRRGEGLQVEPLVERLADFALHGLLSPDGSLQVGYPTMQRCSPLGVWEGSVLAGSELHEQEREALYKELRSVGAALHQLGYFGPFNVDAFAWRGKGGQRCFQPRCEINARYTMGWAVGMRVGLTVR